MTCAPLVILSPQISQFRGPEAKPKSIEKTPCLAVESRRKLEQLEAATTTPSVDRPLLETVYDLFLDSD
jgi:hypothetical protein